MSELQQQSFGQSYNQISAVNAKHLACVLLLDTSGSMSADGKIESLNEGINRFIEQTSTDKVTRETVDLCVIEFNTHAKVVQDFTPICQVPPIRLEANGLTAMGEGINLALDKAKERNNLYYSIGAPCFKPWICMITDGIPTDDISSAQSRIQERESKRKLKFWSFGVSDYDKDVLMSLSPRAYALDNYDFTGFFNWLSQSMTTISNSEPGLITGIQAPPATILSEDW